MWRPIYDPVTKSWEVYADGEGPQGEPGFVAKFELGSEATEACRAVNAMRGIEPRRAEWEATR